MTNSRSVSIVAFAVVASLLLATAPGAVAADVNSLMTGSAHSTSSDFQNAEELTNLSVSGDEVVLSEISSQNRWTFEDEGTTETAIDSNGGLDGSISGPTYTGDAAQGSHALDFTSPSDEVRVPDDPAFDGQQFGVAAWTKLDSDTSDNAYIVTRYLTSGDNREWLLRYNGNTGEFEFQVTTDGTTNTLVTASASADPTSYHHVAGVFNGTHITLYIDGQAVDWTPVSSRFTGPADFVIGSIDDFDGAPDGQIDDVHYWSRAPSSSEIQSDANNNAGSPESASYLSQTHQVTGAKAVEINVTEATDISGTLTAQYYDGSSWVTVSNSTSFSSAGSHSVILPGVNSEQWRVKVDIQTSSENAAFALARDAVLFSAQAPSGTLQSPADGAELTESSVDFSIDVSDADFGTAQGDSVTATLQLRGPGESSWTDYGTDTATSNSTVTVSEEITTGGEWEYRFRLEDSYGESTTTASRSVFVPAELEVRSALPPHELINDVNLTVRFYEDGGEERVFQRTPTDGTISLAGLPTTNFVVTVRANESYAYRRIVLDSLYEQSTVYLLPDNATSSQIVFQLDDRTGRFDAAQTTLYIEAPITRDFNGDGNETTRYVTIAGDTFGGSEQFPVTLENNQRYRLRVENENGETRVLGSYTAAGDAVAVLPLGQVVIDSEVGEGGVAFDAAIREAEDGSRYIRVVYRDPEMATQSLSLEVTNPDTGTTIRANSTMQGPYGRYIETVPLPASANDSQTYLIDWNAERNASVVGGQERVGNVNAFVGDIDVDPAIRGLIGYGAIIGLTGLVIIRSPRVAGVVGVGTAVVVSALGVVSIAPSALGIGGAIAVLAFVGGGGR